jgi:hypothetical protein
MNAAEQPDTVLDYYSAGLRARFRMDATKAAVTLSTESYADISYEVDEAAFRRRSAARLAERGLATSVPAGWPTKLEGPLVWTAADFNEADESAYVYSLTDEDKEEISKALEDFKGEMGQSKPWNSESGCLLLIQHLFLSDNRKGARRQRSVAGQLPSSQYERKTWQSLCRRL